MNANMNFTLDKRLITVDEYYLMAEAGILKADDRVELVNGELINMSPSSSRHSGTVNKISRVLNQLVGDDFILSVQNPTRLNQHSEPEPDVMLLKPREDFYMESHPGPQDVVLVIEVAENSQEYDKVVKARMYAEAGMPEYWVVDTVGRSIMVHTRPEAGGYRRISYFQEQDELMVAGKPVGCNRLI
jgi:Uma2 family endonuclease